MLSKILEDFNPWWRDPDARPNVPGQQRNLFDILRARIARPEERRAVVLMGPRQVGKTTLLRQLAASILEEGFPAGNLTYFDFSDDRLTETTSPREIVQTAPPSCRADQPRIFLLDEISRAQRWDAWLKAVVDSTQHRYLVTDSAAGVLREGSVESGLGRWDEFHMEALSFPEFLRLQADRHESVQDVLDRIPNALARYLMLGGFPEHVLNPSVDEVRRRLRGDIADRAVLRDLARRRVREIEKIRDLFVYLIQDSGSILDVRSRAEALGAEEEGADPRSVRSWLRILEETDLIVSLPRHGGGPTGRLRGKSRPKVYAADHGLICAFSVSPEPLRDERDRGRIFEAVVLRHLRDVVRPAGTPLAYFRKNERIEIDFVLETGSALVGIEVTSSRDPAPEKIRRLQEAGEALGADRLVLVHDGLPRQNAGKVVMAQIRQFLLDPAEVLAI